MIGYITSGFFPRPGRQDRRDDKLTKKWLYEGMVVKFVARPARHASVLDLAMQLQTNVRELLLLFLAQDTKSPARSTNGLLQ